MSCYNWESGIIQLPKAKYAAIRKQFIKDYNTILEREMEAGNKLRDYVLEMKKSKRNVQWFYVLQDHMEHFGVSFSTICKMHIAGKKPRKLTKKLMEFANNKTNRFDVDSEGDIVFNPESKIVMYDVMENNRAVERARESKVGQLFFRTMDRIEWTRGSGGEIVGNDEYNRDCGYAGGGANYVTQTFGK